MSKEYRHVNGELKEFSIEINEMQGQEEFSGDEEGIMFVKVTGIDGANYYINPSRVMVLEEYKVGKFNNSNYNGDACTVVFSSDSLIRVRGSMEEIVSLLRCNKA